MQKMKQLKDLNLMDRFLFAQAMEDPENLKTVVEIITQKEIELKYLPQTEKEQRISPANRFVKLDVWAQDVEDTVYDAEVQKANTGNLPKCSRYYQSMIDSKLLLPGEINFNALNPVYIIIIASFDLFGLGKYMYTFKMMCEEESDVALDDGAVRIFLNTKGRNPEEVSPELVELLKYMEHTNEETSRECKSERIHQMQERIKGIKSSEKVGVKYMQEWEERELERQKALEEGHMSGLARGIHVFIEAFKETGMSKEDVEEKVADKFGLSSSEVEKYMKKYWIE